MVQLSFEIIQLIFISVMKLFDIPRTVAWRLASNSKDGDGARSPLARGFGSPADHLRLENSSKWLMSKLFLIGIDFKVIHIGIRVVVKYNQNDN